MDPVVVVGGGPVGMLNALGLARAGIPVTIAEREPDSPLRGAARREAGARGRPGRAEGDLPRHARPRDAVAARVTI